MGLDMFLEGRISYVHNKPEPIEGHEVSASIVELGYWRKHPNLHGYIVKEFADGVDECQPIGLDAEGLDQILAAVEANNLPHTTGFFFGSSEGPHAAVERVHTIAALEKAKEFLKKSSVDAGFRSVTYYASW